MTFKVGELRVFDKSGAPIGVLTGTSITGPPSFRLNEVEDMAFDLPRNDGGVSLLYDSVAPIVEGNVSDDVTTGELRLPNPAGTLDGHVLVASISYDTNSATDHGYIKAPEGWESLAVREVNGGSNDHGLHVFARVWRSGDPVARTFRLRARDDDAILTENVTGGLTTLSGVRTDLLKGARVVDLDMTENASGTPHIASVPPNGVVNPLTLFAWSLNDGSGALTDAFGTTQQIEEIGSAAVLHVATRIETLHDDAPSTVTLTSANSVTSVGVAIMFYPWAGTMQMLERDNLVFMQSESTEIPAWAGEIDEVNFDERGAQVRLVGTMNLMTSIPTLNIEQNAGVASTIAFRLVESANTWKGAHGDMRIGLTIDDTNANYGLYEYEGDILRGLQTLMQRTISEAYMESSIVPDTGYLSTRLHWGAEYGFATGLTLKDGVGANLAPGTAINFTGAQKVNYGRLLGTETNIKEYLDYPAVLNVTEDIVPETSAVIPEAKMPGARRRAALDLSVDWGLTKERQEKLAREAQDLYLGYYKDFLFAYHSRFGMPFLPGFEWTGPDSDQFKSMSGRNYRTTAVLASLTNREIVTDWDPDAEADVELDGWYHIEDINISNGIRGIAYDHTETTYRYIGRADGSLATLRAVEPFDISPPVIGSLLRYSGENLWAIATDGLEPGTVWAMTRSADRTYIRRWDVDAATFVREWYVQRTDIRDIAVNVERGHLYASHDGDGIISQYDLNNGVELATFTTGLSEGRGISVSGDFGYVIGPDGAIEIYHLKDLTFAAGHATSNPDGRTPSSLFVDPRNAQVWIVFNSPEDAGNTPQVSLYSAAIAVDESDGGGPVDGVPGFDQISAGAFVRIVMADTRDLGEVPEAIRGVKGIKHLNQFGHYVNGVWKSWGTKFDKYNCSFASCAMLLDRHTFGKVRVTPKRLRKLSGDKAGGSTFWWNARAWKKLGYKLNYTVDGNWSDVVDKLRLGRGIVIFGDYDQLPEKYRCAASFGGNHAVYVHKIDGQGRFIVHDPLCRKSKRIPSKWMRRYAGKFHGSMGKAVYGWSKKTSKKTAATIAKTYYIVWSEGEYKDITVPGAPGDPAQVIRTWDPKEQKSGFKTRSKVTLEPVEQIIVGEEGRVGDWDPTAMGYGIEGRHYYRARDGTIMESEGWHLRPWDIPIETFALNNPPWPEGEEYLRRLLVKFNREQGAQVFPVLNIAGIWTDIKLGALFSVDCALIGGHTTGIQGTVRIIQFTPDYHNGVMQVLAEWVG